MVTTALTVDLVRQTSPKNKPCQKRAWYTWELTLT